MKARITAKFIPMLFEFMAKKDVRYYLCGMHIQPFAEGGTILTATDGHRAIMIWDEHGIADGDYILPLSKDIKQFAGKREAGCVEFFDNAAWVVNDQIKNGRSSFPITEWREREIGDFRLDPIEEPANGQITARIAHVEPAHPIDGDYPNTVKLFKEFKCGEVSEIGVNPKYIGALKCIDGGVIQHLSSSTSSILFRPMSTELHDVVAVLVMPMRVPEGRSYSKDPMPEFIQSLSEPQEDEAETNHADI